MVEKVNTEPKWQVNILIKGNLLISQEKAFRAWIGTRGGVSRREVVENENLVWHAQFVSTGANCLMVQDWVVVQLRKLCPGDRLNAARVTVAGVSG